jgi:hypothetical protein
VHAATTRLSSPFLESTKHGDGTNLPLKEACLMVPRTKEETWNYYSKGPPGDPDRDLKILEV